MTQTIDLYTPKDVATVRQLLLNEQGGDCKLLGININASSRVPVCDHAHDNEQLVRAVLEREANAFLGVVENAYKRFLRYWLPTTLPQVLRLTAEYLEASERHPEKRYRHPHWIKKVTTMFNSLKTKQQDSVLKELGFTDRCTNTTQRKKAFANLTKDRNIGYNSIFSTITKAKDE